MEKFFYCIGIYGFCVIIHESVNYIMEPIDAEIKRKFRERQKGEKERPVPNKSKNLSTGEVGDPINRIGF